MLALDALGHSSQLSLGCCLMEVEMSKEFLYADNNPYLSMSAATHTPPCDKCGKQFAYSDLKSYDDLAMITLQTSKGNIRICRNCLDVIKNAEKEYKHMRRKQRKREMKAKFFRKIKKKLGIVSPYRFLEEEEE